MSPVSQAGRRGLGFRLAGIVLLGAMRVAGEDTLDEYQLKGGFVFNITKFVDWPAEAFASPDDPLVGCVLGESPISAVLGRATQNRAINGRKVLIRPISNPRQIVGCDFVFVSSSAQKSWRAAPNDALAGILTIGEGEALDAVMVNLKLEGDKIRIQIDLEAARRAKLQISSNLLSLSEIVKR